MEATSKPKFVYVTYIATTPEKLWAALTKAQGERTKVRLYYSEGLALVK